MNLLLDTNVLIAALITKGFCYELFEHCIREHKLVTSNFIIMELQEKLISKFHFSKKETLKAANLIFSRMKKVESLTVDKSACPDPFDLEVLGTAVSGECQFLITGDKGLLGLSEFQGVKIISPRHFWRQELKK